MAHGVFEGLKPEGVWEHFAEISRIPRPSGREGEITGYVTSWAAARGYELSRDVTGNLVVRVPASPGREAAPVVVLQGHLDMVCEKEPGSPNDPEAGRLALALDGDWLRAEGTTLGADNGLGIAAGLALADDPDAAHGPLELLMTVDEETGLTGAKRLDASMIRGRIMLNLDSEEDGVLCVGCAGGTDTLMRLPLVREAVPEGSVALEVVVSGLRGGHSGVDIDRNRLNAIHALVRTLQAGAAVACLRIAAIDGGTKRNAIPRDAEAVVLVDDAGAGGLREALDTERAAMAAQHAGIDDGLALSVERISPAPTSSFGPADSARLLGLLRAIPSGVVAMSQDIRGLVETSSNLGVVRTDGDAIETVSCSRSSVASAMADILARLRSIGELAGAEVRERGGYPGWKPDLSSHALAVTREAFRRLFDADPEVTAVHAGLECGLIGQRIPEMDMVSFGPEIRGAHAPGERVHLPSVSSFWRLLVQVVDDLSAEAVR